jgi:hypothetical protein
MQSRGTPSFARASQSAASAASSTFPTQSTRQDFVPSPHVTGDGFIANRPPSRAQSGGVALHGVAKKSHHAPTVVASKQPSREI